MIQPDGKFIIGGRFISVLGRPRSNIARLNVDGTLDRGFDPYPNGMLYSLAVQADGKILLGGGFTWLLPKGATVPIIRNRVARLNADGTLDMGFDPNANGLCQSLHVQADGKILLGGEFTTLQPNGAASPTARRYIARLNADGTLDTGFDPNASGIVRSLALQMDGKILLGGEFTTLQPNGAALPTVRNRIARVNADGTLDLGFDPNANSYVTALAVQADGKVLLGGYFTHLQSNGAALPSARRYIARVHTDGALDLGFHPNPNSAVESIAVQVDGKVILGGGFIHLQPNGAAVPTVRHYVARVNGDGTLDMGFDPNPLDWVPSLSLQADGKLLLGGIFSSLQPNLISFPIKRHRFARVLNDPVSQTLSAPDASKLRWLRGGAGPELHGVTFDLSIDNGTTWANLGQGTHIVGGWELSGLSLPSICHVRARGRTSGGLYNGSSGLIEQIEAVGPEIVVFWGASTLPADALSDNVGTYRLAPPSPGGSTRQTFTIQNVGYSDLRGLAVSVTGANPGEFTLGNLGSTLAPGASTSFTVTFTPASSGFRTAVLSIASNDGEESLFEINLSGADNSSMVVVSGNGVKISNGDSTPSLSDHTDFGPAVVADARVVIRDFTITNMGGADLALGTVTVSGPNSSDFVVTTTPSTSVAPEGRTNFQVRFDPRGLGLRQALVSFSTNDSDENPLQFSIQGKGLSVFPGDLDPLDARVEGGAVYATAVQPDGKMIIAGRFTSVLGVPRKNIARLHADGTLDMEFAPNAYGYIGVQEFGSVNSVAVQTDGKILLGGEFVELQPNGLETPTNRNYIARVHADGTLDMEFNPNPNRLVRCMAVQPDGKILLGGEFTTLRPNGAASPTVRNRIARVNADGTLDTGFDPNPEWVVRCLAVQEDGKILLGGEFTALRPNGAASPTTRSHIARLNADGTVDMGFDPNPNGSVHGMAVQPDGKVLLLGGFTTLQPNGVASPTTRDRFARVNADGTLDMSFDPPRINQYGYFSSLAVQADGKVLLGGDFTILPPNGEASPTRNKVARVLADGTLDTDFDPNPSGYVNCVALQADGKVLLGGSFLRFRPNRAASSTERQGFARLLNDSASQTLSLRTRDRLTWARSGAGPEVYGVSFELSSNNGVSWSSLGLGTRIEGGWELSGLSLPANGFVRARGRTSGGQNNGSSGLIEQVVALGPDIAVFSGVSTSQADALLDNKGGYRLASPLPGGSSTRTFTIQNVGLADLTGLALSKSGANPEEFTVSALGTTTLAPGAGTSFSVAFTPATSGRRTAVLSIASNDGDESPFEIHLRGADNSPEIVVSGSGVEITNRDSLSDHADFGPAAVSHARTVVRTFTITNIGGGPLALGPVAINGPNGADFTVTTTPNTPVASDSTTGFSIRFAPTGLGLRRALVSIGSNDSDANPMEFSIQGTGISHLPGDLDPLHPLVEGDPVVFGETLQPDGKIIIVGYFSSVLGVPRPRIARINADGTLDMGFNPNPNSYVSCLAVQPDGKILLGGEFTTLQPNGAASPITRSHIARLNADGTVDMGFDSNPNDSVACLAVQADGKVVLGGAFESLQGIAQRHYIARVNADGTLDMGFDPNPNGYVSCLAVQPDGKIIIVGNFSSVLGVPRHRIARMNADGTLDMGFNPNPNSYVYCLAVQPDGKILLGGKFTALQPNGAASPTVRNYIARLNTDGTLDLGFSPNPNNIVLSVAVQADGKMLLGGAFTTLRPNGVGLSTQRHYIARVNADGTLDMGFDPKANYTVHGILLQADGKVLLAGGFTTLQPNGAGSPTARQGLARLLNDPASQSLTVSSASKLTWARSGAGPEVYDVTFELSSNSGVTWTSLGLGTRIAGGWELGGLSLPSRGSIRARGRTSGGYLNGSSGFVEQVSGFNFAYQTWASTALPGVREAERAVDYDFDGDGKENGWEYFIGSDPKAYESTDIVPALSSPGTVAFEYPRRRGLGIVETVQVSNSLRDFTPLAPTEYTRELIDNGPGQPETVRITIPHGTSPRRFFRIAVEM